MEKFLNTLTKVSLFKGYSDSEFANLFNIFIKKSYGKGDIIFHENEDGNELFIVVSGKVKICRFTDKREIILSILSTGDYFGEMAILQANETRSATAIAIESTTLFVLKREDFLNLLKSNPEMTLKLLHTALNRLRKTNELIKDLTSLDSKSRIFKTILYLIDEYGYEGERGIVIDFKVTHQGLADMSGTVRETVTKALLELQKEQIINVDKKKIIIKDIELLKQKIDVFD